MRAIQATGRWHPAQPYTLGVRRLLAEVPEVTVRHNIDYKKVHAKVGQRVPVYPFPWLGKPFVGVVQKVKMNKFGRVSYVIDGKEVHAEELLPAKDQPKLRMKA